MPASKVKQYLDNAGVKYVNIAHSLGYTAQEIASLAHIPGRELAKTVMVYVDDQLAMAVLPASLNVSLHKLKDLTGAQTVTLATEGEFRDAFPDCETGAMPPFGNLYGLPVYVELRLTFDDEIAFNAGTHRDLIRMKYRDYERLARPQVGEFATAPFAVPAGI